MLKNILQFIILTSKYDIKQLLTFLIKLFIVIFYKTKRKHSLLEKYGIRSKHDMKKWLVKNHPDRGGNQEIFVKVYKEFKESNFCLDS